MADDLKQILEQVRARVHNQNDEVQKQRLQLAEHDVFLRVLRDDVDWLRKEGTTREHLSAARKEFTDMVERHRSDYDGKHNLLEQKLDTVVEQTKAMADNLAWVVKLVLAFVILALLGLVIVGVKSNDRVNSPVGNSGRVSSTAATDGERSRRGHAFSDWLTRVAFPLQAAGRADTQP